MEESSESLQLCRTVVVMVAIVVVVDSLELELDEVYPDEDGDFAGGVVLLREVSVNVRSTVRKIS